MLFIGIDVASRKHITVITTYGQEILSQTFFIPNNLQGFEKFRDEILSHKKHLNGVHIGVEETGTYS